jgi:polyhydroxyalkanoate synthesis regulator phasin
LIIKEWANLTSIKPISAPKTNETNSLLKSIAGKIGQRNGLKKGSKNNLLANLKFFKNLDSYINPRNLIENIVEHLKVDSKDNDWAGLEEGVVREKEAKILGDGNDGKFLPVKVKNLLDRTGSLILSKL